MERNEGQDERLYFWSKYLEKMIIDQERERLPEWEKKTSENPPLNKSNNTKKIYQNQNLQNS